MRQGKFSSVGFELQDSVHLGDRIMLSVVGEVKEIRTSRNRNGEETKTAILAPIEVDSGEITDLDEETEELEKVFS